jgi:Tol biopolymer transport system component
VVDRTLSHYRIVERLGAGGMGEVYRAHDEKLDRDVALKVLPEGALADEAARSRFRKEAHALSRLSHPHIAHLLDFDSEDGIDFLVMELVTGPSLAEKLREGPLPEKGVVRLGAQLARGLQAAHEQGVIHRDLKPSNLHLTPDGLLKILDFGLARLLQPKTTPGHSTATETAAGAIVGSPPYMAPEQLLGKPPDARTDLYAAGAVLYETATGRRPFGERTGVALTDAILHHPPLSPRAVAESLSPGLESVILKSLDKDPELRHQTAKDLLVDLERLQLRSSSGPAAVRSTADFQGRLELHDLGDPGGDEIASATPTRSARRWRELFAWGVALVSALGAVLAWKGARDRALEQLPGPLARLTLEVPSDVELAGSCLSVAPDGRHVALVTPGTEGWLLSLDGQAPRRLAGSPMASTCPFWAPDGSEIAFATWAKGRTELRAVRLEGGGAPSTIATLESPRWAFGGATWGPRDEIVASVAGRLYAVSVPGGETRLVLEPDASRGEQGFYGPELLPDGRGLLYTAQFEHGVERWFTALNEPARRKRVLSGVARAQYHRSGRLLYARDGELFAESFDAARGELLGSPSRLGQVAMNSPWSGLFCASPSVLAYIEGGNRLRELKWFDRKGTLLGTLGGGPRSYWEVRLSPDDSRAAVAVSEQPTGRIWIADLARGVITPAIESAGHPLWSPDGRSIYHSRGMEDGVWRIHRRPLDGVSPSALLLDSPVDVWPKTVTPDGTVLLYISGEPSFNNQLHALTLLGEPRSELLMKVDHSIEGVEISPDGRWLAYISNETGDWEVFVAPYRREGQPVRISTAGGLEPRWRGDGRELFYATPGDQLMAVTLEQADGKIKVGDPTSLFHAGVMNPYFADYDVTRDGQRFLVITRAEGSRGSLKIVLNWTELLN